MTKAARPIRIAIPGHLQTLAGVSGEVVVEVPGETTIRAALDALEARHPVLRGTIRDHGTKQRRAFVRFFVCNEDWSHDAQERHLPDPIVDGSEAFVVLGAMSGG